MSFKLSVRLRMLYVRTSGPTFVSKSKMEFKFMSILILANQFLFVCSSFKASKLNIEEMPVFEGTIPNVTVALGRDLILPCTINKLGNYRVAWLRVEDKGILTIHTNVITRNYRVSLSTNENTYFLHIRNVQESDRGGYMCQINSVPMRSQVGYVQVVVPPDIIIEESSSDLITTENSNVTLRCKAKGFPTPKISWKREDQTAITLQNNQNGQRNRYTAQNKTGESLVVTRVTRVHSGPYLCIASNGVPPSVSRRIILHVHFPPSIWIPNQKISANLHDEVSLDCHVEAYPTPVVMWVNSRGEPLSEHSGPENKLKIQLREKQYKTHLRLTIRNLNHHDFGIYKCVSKNTLGEQEAVVHLEENSDNYHSLSKNRNDFSTVKELSNDLTSQISDSQLTDTDSNSIQQNAQKSKKPKKPNDKIYSVYAKIWPKKSSATHSFINCLLFHLTTSLSLWICLRASFR